MAMPEADRPRAQQVLNDIFDSYAHSYPYDLVLEPSPIGVNDVDFAYDRRNKIFPLIALSSWDSPRKERDSFLSEWIVMLGFRKILECSELDIELAPPHLEIGSEGRKGVDLVASRKIGEKDKRIPTFAINVKMQQLKYNRRTEVYKYDSILGCPAIELSLGDFSIQTKKSGEVSIVPWLRQVATPNITNSGKIPDFRKWQKYLIGKASETISHYMVKIDDYLYGDYELSENEAHLFPADETEFRRFYENLTFSYLLFKELLEG